MNCNILQSILKKFAREAMTELGGQNTSKLVHPAINVPKGIRPSLRVKGSQPCREQSNGDRDERDGQMQAQWHRRTKMKNSAFAESLEEPVQTHRSRCIRSKLEPRVEPQGGKGREMNSDPQIGLTNFLREYPRAEPSKRTLLSSILHRSNSERRFLGPRKRTSGLIASRRMSDGRAYGQIVIGDFYDAGANASTYKGNNVEDIERLSRMKGRRLMDERRKSEVQIIVTRPSAKRREIDSDHAVEDCEADVVQDNSGLNSSDGIHMRGGAQVRPCLHRRFCPYEELQKVLSG